jgi:MoaA/NifB/PqqE/SkfB family radical SAM enzyme
VKYIQEKGLDIELMSNGRPFSDRNLVSKVIQEEINNFLIYIYGHNKEIHDSITGKKGSFDKTIKGIHNLLEAGADVSFYFVLNGLNYKYLDEIMSFLDGFDYKSMHIKVIPPSFDNYSFKQADFVSLLKKLDKLKQANRKIKLKDNFVLE